MRLLKKVDVQFTKKNVYDVLESYRSYVRMAGAEIFGRVLEKGRHGMLYTLTIRDYGIFVVTKDVYDKVKVGDEVIL